MNHTLKACPVAVTCLNSFVLLSNTSLQTLHEIFEAAYSSFSFLTLRLSFLLIKPPSSPDSSSLFSSLIFSFPFLSLFFCFFVIFSFSFASYSYLNFALILLSSWAGSAITIGSIILFIYSEAAFIACFFFNIYYFFFLDTYD